MIYTITLNPAIDEVLTLEKLNPNNVSAVVKIERHAGGKGVNVAKALNILGEESESLVLLGESSKEFFLSEFKKQGVVARPFYYKGETRLSHTLVFAQDCFNTHIKRPGDMPDSVAYDQLKQYLAAVVQTGDYVIFSGSVPNGLSDTVYQELIDIVKKKQGISFLDASGDALDHGINAFPFCLKINLDEFIDFAEQTEEELTDFKNTVQQLHQAGIALIIITMGAEGAVLYDGNDFVHAKVNEKPAELEQRYSVGSGDTFLAGFVKKFIEKKPIEDCLCYAAACGSANALHPGSAVFTVEDVQQMLEKVDIKKEF